MQASIVILTWIAALRLSSSIANSDDDGRTRPRLFPQNQLDRQQRPARLLAHEWMAIMTGRTLIEMSPSERADMMTLVVNALESVAEDAGERGDLKSARNATYLACSIRGCGIEASTDMLGAAEILLEQGINYVASLSERIEGVSDESDEPEVSSEHQFRILH